MKLINGDLSHILCIYIKQHHVSLMRTTDVRDAWWQANLITGQLKKLQNKSADD